MRHYCRPQFFFFGITGNPNSFFLDDLVKARLWQFVIIPALVVQMDTPWIDSTTKKEIHLNTQISHWIRKQLALTKQQLFTSQSAVPKCYCHFLSWQQFMCHKRKINNLLESPTGWKGFPLSSLGTEELDTGAEFYTEISFCTVFFMWI